MIRYLASRFSQTQLWRGLPYDIQCSADRISLGFRHQFGTISEAKEYAQETGEQTVEEAPLKNRPLGRSSHSPIGPVQVVGI